MERAAAIKESQNLVQCLKAADPSRRKKDITDQLGVTPSMLTFVERGEKPFSAAVRELGRYKLAEDIDALTGHRHTLPGLVRLAKSMIDCCREQGQAAAENFLTTLEG